MYYKGGFSDGEVEHKNKNKEEFVNNLTHEQIGKYGFQMYSENFLTEYEQKNE